MPLAMCVEREYPLNSTSTTGPVMSAAPTPMRKVSEPVLGSLELLEHDVTNARTHTKRPPRILRLCMTPDINGTRSHRPLSMAAVDPMKTERHDLRVVHPCEAGVIPQNGLDRFGLPQKCLGTDTHRAEAPSSRARSDCLRGRRSHALSGSLGRWRRRLAIASHPNGSRAGASHEPEPSPRMSSKQEWSCGRLIGDGSSYTSRDGSDKAACTLGAHRSVRAPDDQV